MTETNSQPAEQSPKADRFKYLVVFLTVFTTVVTAIVAGLQADANIRASVSNRDSQEYALLAAGELHHQDLQTAYDLNMFGDYLKDEEETTVLQMTALQMEGNAKSEADSLLRATLAQARALAEQKNSIFFTDSRYAPKDEGGLPDMQAYLADAYSVANDLVAKQNAASEDYDRWNRRGDSYTSVLALLAVAFFLFGLAQALSPRLRLLFAIFGLVALVAAGFWTILILVI